MTDPHLVLEPDLYRCTWRELGTDFRHAVGKVYGMARPSLPAR